MNYTGFRSDPNYIYSFRPTSNTPVIAQMEYPNQAMSALKSSLPYRQTDEKGRRRMEKMVGMGLPFNTDPNRVFQVSGGYGQRPVYAAPRPQPWGSFGSIGMDREEKKPTPAMVVSGGGPQPAQQPSLPPVLPERSLGISSPSLLPFTGFGRITGESPFRTPTIPKETPSPLPRGAAGAMSSPLGIPRFPFAGY